MFCVSKESENRSCSVIYQVQNYDYFVKYKRNQKLILQS